MNTGALPGSMVVHPPSVPGRHLVPQADVGEGAAHHHFVVAAARAVRIEVLPLHAMRDEPLACRAGPRDVARRRDVIGRDRVAEHGERLRAGDLLHPGGCIVIPSKYGGFFTYVESSCHAYVSPLGTSSPASARRP
jgi:hypothetical protein